MSEMLARIIDANAADVVRMRAILEAAEGEERDLTAEETANLATIDAAIEQRNAQRAQIERLEQVAQANDEARSRLATMLVAAPQRGYDTPENSSDILRRFAQAGAGAFELPYDSRALIDGTATNPVEFSTRFAVYQRTLVPILNVATILPSDNGNSMTLPRLTADSTSYTPGEGTAITESTPTISAVTLTVTGWKGLAYLSNELVQDTPLAIDSIVINSAGRSIGIAAGTEWTTGTTGFITLATNGGTALGTAAIAGQNFVSGDDLITLYHGLPAPVRANATWQIGTTALAAIRKYKTTYGEYIMQPAGLNGAQVDTILGRQLYENPAMAALGSASKSVAVGDFSAYYIKELPLRVEVSREFKFDTDQTAIRVVYRAGGQLPDTTAIRYIVSANT